jgi:transitional endoplasmic reticulum ATPase
MVDDSTTDDNSSVQMSQAKLTELGIFKGDPVLIKGKK